MYISIPVVIRNQHSRKKNILFINTLLIALDTRERITKKSKSLLTCLKKAHKKKTISGSV